MFTVGLQPVALVSDGGGEHVDPRADEVLAITEALPVGRCQVCVTATAVSLDDSKALFVIQHRNTADDDTLESVVVAVPVDDTRQFDVVFLMAEGEWIAVVPYVDLLGTVMVALNYQSLG
jgi:hypothetical protein